MVKTTFALSSAIAVRHPNRLAQIRQFLLNFYSLALQHLHCSR